MCAFTHASVHPFTLHFKFSIASAVLSAIADLKSILSNDLSASCESVIILTYLLSCFLLKDAVFQGKGGPPVFE